MGLPTHAREGNEILIRDGEREYRFDWRDADIATALYRSLYDDRAYEQRRRQAEPLPLRDVRIGDFFLSQDRLYQRIEPEGNYLEGPATAISISHKAGERFSFSLDHEVVLAPTDIQSVGSQS